MPRKVNPRVGEDGYEAEPAEVTLDRTDAEGLAVMLGIAPTSPRVEALRADILDIGKTYRRWKGRGAGAFRRAEARKALQGLLASPSLDDATLSALNERALQAVHDALVMMKPRPVMDDTPIISALMAGQIAEDVLRRAVQDAIDRLDRIKGPERQGDLAWAVTELCRLHEEITGRQATHSSKSEHLAYEQEPQSEAGRFVRRCFQRIDASIGPSAISRALRQFIESRN